MPAIRELKERLVSVKSAGKITTALQMVASSKLKKAARATENFIPFKKMLYSILDDFISSDMQFESPFRSKRKLKNVTLVAISSNSGFCGSFNAVIIDALRREVNKYKQLDLHLVTIGKKVSQAAKKLKVSGVVETWDQLVIAPDYDQTRQLADYLMDLYLKKKTDLVELIYFRYKNPLVHDLTVLKYLPMEFDKEKHNSQSYLHLYLLEPPAPILIGRLLPKVLRSILYAAVLDSFSSEQGARTIAMQMASDNARKLTEDLSLELNRQRQQLITTEILELSAAGDEEEDF